MSNKESLSDKTLTMFVGPSAIGKSTVMEEVTALHPDTAYTRSITTRSPRPGEKSHYIFIDTDEARRLRDADLTFTYNEHPTTHDIYGTTAESFPGRHNLLDTLSGNVTEYRALPFERTTTLAVAAPAEQWRAWFTDRYPEPVPEAEKRLAEAALSINWALNDPETHWLVNRDGMLQEVARRAIATVLSPSPERTIPDEPYAMLELIENNTMWR